MKQTTTLQQIVDETQQAIEEIVEHYGYKNYILALMQMERELPVEELEIDYFTWMDSDETSPLHPVLIGLADDYYDNYSK